MKGPEDERASVSKYSSVPPISVDGIISNIIYWSQTRLYAWHHIV